MRCGAARPCCCSTPAGIRYLGQTLLKDLPISTDLFLTHTHFDHVVGLPFFVPFFIKGNHVRLWAAHLKPKGLTLRHVISEMMFSPLFPVPPEIFAADVDYLDFDAGSTLEPATGIAVRTTALSHPDNATGYRIEYNGKSICYLTDTQHSPGKPDQNILGLIEGADIVIYDCTYTDEEFTKRADWGHSTWEEGVRLCDAANVKTFVVFHHDPDPPMISWTELPWTWRRSARAPSSPAKAWCSGPKRPVLQSCQSRKVSGSRRRRHIPLMSATSPPWGNSAPSASASMPAYARCATAPTTQPYVPVSSGRSSRP